MTLLTTVLAGLSLASMAGFAAPSPSSPKPVQTGPRTVMATFHVIAGKEADFERLLVRQWETYTSGKLVFDHPRVVVQGKEADGKPYFVHIFTWVSYATPDNPPPSVIPFWKSMEPLVEARNGRPAMEIIDVQLVAPKT
jgi:hypothetical protein